MLRRSALLALAILACALACAEATSRHHWKCSHQVTKRHGETLKEIANHYDISHSYLRRKNHWLHEHVPHGTWVWLPVRACDKHRDDRNDRHCTYTVKRGDSMWKIAHAYGINLHDLIAQNKQIHDPNRIHVGDKVNVPCSKKH